MQYEVDDAAVTWFAGRCITATRVAAMPTPAHAPNSPRLLVHLLEADDGAARPGSAQRLPVAVSVSIVATTVEQVETGRSLTR